MATALLVPVLLEIGSPQKGYKWVEGYQVVQPTGREIFPYMRKREAIKYCKDQGWGYVIQPNALRVSQAANKD